jgi:hypothetical protein
MALTFPSDGRDRRELQMATSRGTLAASATMSNEMGAGAGAGIGAGVDVS